MVPPLFSGGAGALSLLHPWVLWALALAAPILLLHLYHRRRHTVPHLPLLLEALGPRRPGGGWRRLRDGASLLLRLLALALVVLAAGGLAPAAAAPPPPPLVLVVDADVTTEVVETDGRSRYEHALELARAAVAADAWAVVTVLEAREAPAVLVSRTRDVEHALATLARVAGEVRARRRGPCAGTADLAAAVTLARGLAAPSPAAARVVVLSARPMPPEGGRVAGGLEVWGVGRTRDDQGLVSFEVARGPDDVRVRIRARVRNDAATLSRRDLVLRLDETEVERRSLALEADAEASVEVDLVPPRDGAWLDVALDGEDAFARNDAALAWLPPPLRPSVLVVHDGRVRPFTRAIIEAMGDGIDVAASGSVRAEDVGRAELRDVVLVDGVSLPPGALRPGAWLFLAPLGGALPFEVGGMLTRPIVWRTEPDHPLVRDLDLATAWVTRGQGVSGPGLRALAEAEGRTVVAEGEHAGVRYVVLALDPEASDLPVRAALPLLVRGALRRLAASPRAPLRPFYRAGEVLRPALPLPGGGEGARIRWAGQEVEVALAVEGEGWAVPAGARGPVEVVTRGGTWRGHTALVDLSPERSVVPARAAAARPAAARRQLPEVERWRRALVVAAALLLLLDLAVLARRRRAAGELARGI